MIAKIVSFQLPADMTRDAVVAAAREAARDWIDHPGLVRKDFLLDADNVTYGYYLFRDRESAELAHDAAFVEQLRERFGAVPKMEYFDHLLTADAETGKITDR
ncbi:MAG: hypothetical protein ACR2QV_08430 [Gammaproteobacteria bacterium]